MTNTNRTLLALFIWASSSLSICGYLHYQSQSVFDYASYLIGGLLSTMFAFISWAIVVDIKSIPDEQDIKAENERKDRLYMHMCQLYTEGKCIKEIAETITNEYHIIKKQTK